MAVAEIERPQPRLELLELDPGELDQEAIERRIDQLDEVAWKRGREATLAKVEIGRCLLVQKSRQSKGFVSWAKARWGYSQQYGTVLMFLGEKHARVRALLDADPDLPLRKIASGLKQELRDTTQAPARQDPVFPVATPADVVLEVLDAGAELPDRVTRAIRRSPREGVDLVVTSWPYGIGQTAHGYVDVTTYDQLLEAMDAWASTLVRVGSENARYCINLPLDVRKDGPPRPLALHGLQALLRRGLRYQTAIIWRKASNGHLPRSNRATGKRLAFGSIDSPNAPCVTTGDELVLVVHKGNWNLGRAGEPSDSTRTETIEWRNAEWTIVGRRDARYPHVFPAELVERCIKLFSFPGDLVADLHCGSGTTAVAALRLGRTFVGGDINAYAVALASQEVEAAWSKLQEARGS